MRAVIFKVFAAVCFRPGFGRVKASPFRLPALQIAGGLHAVRRIVQRLRRFVGDTGIKPAADGIVQVSAVHEPSLRKAHGFKLFVPGADRHVKFPDGLPADDLGAVCATCCLHLFRAHPLAVGPVCLVGQRLSVRDGSLRHAPATLLCVELRGMDEGRFAFVFIGMGKPHVVTCGYKGMQFFVKTHVKFSRRRRRSCGRSGRQCPGTASPRRHPPAFPP